MSKRSKYTQRMKTPNLRNPALTIWDPGTISDVCNNNRISLNQRNDTNHAKEIKTNIIHLPKSPSTRASPNKSQDSGFSDSGDSETSSSIKSSDSRPHVTRVYFYSSSNLYNESSESHYQSPSSLPVFPPNLIEKPSKNFGNSVSVQDIAKNKDEKAGLRGASSFSGNKAKYNTNEKIVRKNAISAPISYECNKLKNYGSEKNHIGSNCSVISGRKFEENSANFDKSHSLSRNPQGLYADHRNVIRLTTDDSLSEPEINRMNSITVLLNEFRKEDPSYCDEKHATAYPTNSSPVAMTASISLPSSPSISDFSENSSFSSGSSNFQPLKRNPIDHWLSELPSLCESECSVMLQSKSLQGPEYNTASKCQSYQDIKIIQEQARQVSKCFADLCRILSSQSRNEKLLASITVLKNEVHKLISSNSAKRKVSILMNDDLMELPGLKMKKLPSDILESDKNSILIKEHQKIQNLLHDLTVSSMNMNKSHLAKIVEIVTQFGACLTVLVELMLSAKVEAIVSSLKDPSSVSELEVSLVNITSLGLEGNHLCRLVTKYGGVSMLVRLLTNSKFKSVRGIVLRSLGTVCCVLEAIRQLEEVRGVEVIARLLGEKSSTEMEKAEAAGVLAQVTSPWIEDNDYVLGVTENAFFLVKSLTDMCRSTKCAEAFLLSSAALANLSFLSPLILTAMSQMDTVSVLLSFLSRNVSPSIYIQDQVATVLANMAARQDTRDLLLNCDLVHVLLYLLAASPAKSELPVMAATQRVQQKAAISIGRLANEPSVVAGVLSGSGLERLVELSVCKKARLDSDSTLVAVITAVRKISLSHNITHLLENLGATELLNPCLVNSFKLFSTKHESFV